MVFRLERQVVQLVVALQARVVGLALEETPGRAVEIYLRHFSLVAQVSFEVVRKQLVLRVLQGVIILVGLTLRVATFFRVFGIRDRIFRIVKLDPDVFGIYLKLLDHVVLSGLLIQILCLRLLEILETGPH